MKHKVFDWRKDNLLKEDIDNELDLNIVLDHSPVEDDEAVDGKYLDNVMKDVAKGEWLDKPIPPKHILDFQGPEITKPNKETLNLKDIKTKGGDAVGVVVDAKGRVTDVISKITGDYFPPDYKVSWDKITDRPTTLDGYGITDLVSSNKHAVIKGETKVTSFPNEPLSPVPFNLLDAIIEEAGGTMRTGSFVIKHQGANTSGFLISNGSTITSDKYPDLVKHLTGNPKATSAKLPDYYWADFERFYKVGLKANTYIKI